MIFTKLLLAFQLENYNNLRFLKFIYTHPRFWILGSKRQTLDYTAKAKLILILSILFFLFDIAASLYFLTWVWKILSLLWVMAALPLYFIVANIIVIPLDRYLKNKIIKKAKNEISQFKNLRVIAITGSYGKTTTKEILSTILWESFKVLPTQGTKNTPLWISRLILNELNESHEVFIVEMWAYEKWDIAELCDIVWPDISILTGITLQHLERFRSLDNIIDAKFEILQALWENDFAVVDTTTQWVQKWLKEKHLAVKNIIQVQDNIPYEYKENLGGTCFTIDGKQIETKLLAKYIGQTLAICYEISKYLWQDIGSFQKWVSKIDFVEHRMQLIHNKQSNVYIIDDSFNGNLQWIQAILDLMKHAPFPGRKILIAWGIVELWNKTQEVHLALGKPMWEAADMILLVEWPVWNAIEKWLLSSGYPTGHIKKYKTPLLLHEDLKNITQSGDMIVFQNDLPDHYL